MKKAQKYKWQGWRDRSSVIGKKNEKVESNRAYLMIMDLINLNYETATQMNIHKGRFLQSLTEILSFKAQWKRNELPQSHLMNLYFALNYKSHPPCQP
jgi:hypothetical protein